MTDTTYAVDEEVHTAHGIYRVRLEQDEITRDCFADDGPRSYDGKVAVICADAGDSRASTQPWESDLIDTDMLDEHAFDVIARWLRIFHDATVVLPLHASNDWVGTALTVIDHGRPVRAGTYAGIAFDTPKTRAELGENATTAQVEGSIRIELEQYTLWSTGEVYGFIVERVDEDGNVLDNLDSCWGHIGNEWAAEAGIEALAWVIEDEGEKSAAALAEIASDEAEIADLAACELVMPAVTL